MEYSKYIQTVEELELYLKHPERRIAELAASLLAHAAVFRPPRPYTKRDNEFWSARGGMTYAEYDTDNPVLRDVRELFDELPQGTPTAQWLPGAEARDHYFRCCNISPLAPQAQALWQQASHRIQKIWGDRVKYGTMRYPIVKRTPTV
jgi:hypothetical protein